MQDLGPHRQQQRPRGRHRVVRAADLVWRRVWFGRRLKSAVPVSVDCPLKPTAGPRHPNRPNRRNKSAPARQPTSPPPPATPTAPTPEPNQPLAPASREKRPTMNVRVPLRAASTPPETGASTSRGAAPPSSDAHGMSGRGGWGARRWSFTRRASSWV